MAYDFLYNEKRVKQEIKKMKMLKDVGMTMPRSRGKTVVYMQQDRG